MNRYFTNVKLCCLLFPRSWFPWIVVGRNVCVVLQMNLLVGNLSLNATTGSVISGRAKNNNRKPPVTCIIEYIQEQTESSRVVRRRKHVSGGSRSSNNNTNGDEQLNNPLLILVYLCSFLHLRTESAYFTGHRRVLLNIFSKLTYGWRSAG